MVWVTVTTTVSVSAVVVIPTVCSSVSVTRMDVTVSVKTTVSAQLIVGTSITVSVTVLASGVMVTARSDKQSCGPSNRGLVMSCKHLFDRQHPADASCSQPKADKRATPCFMVAGVAAK